MLRRPLQFAVLFLCGLTAWAAWRSGTPAHAGAAPAREVAADYSLNDEEAAAHRWATNQARHWRHLMVQR
jgi:hypothetical protein